ncbi:LysR family transcriptional regulator [beta proteobacterium AAP99]|nr:LysR family transcriptional regulator [beta proteobacterium AAP99]
MDLPSLKTFVAVMRRGSFATVAREQDVHPSIVSRTIAALEDELGFRLFQRTTRKLSPTEAGSLYFMRVAPLVDELERARSEAQDITAEPAGVLRVTASQAFGSAWLAPRLTALRARYPQLALELVLSDSVLDMVAERIDLAIRLGPRPEVGGVATLLMPTHYRVCASPAYLKRHPAPKAPQDLEAHECVVMPLPGFRTRWHFRQAAGQAVTEVSVNGPVVISSPVGLHSSALAGLGPVMLPSWLVGEDLRAGRLIDLFPDWDVSAGNFDTGAWLMYPSRTYLPLKVRAFIDFLKQVTAEEALRT